MPNPLSRGEAAAPDVAARRRYRPRALPALATVVALAVFVWAGGWQKSRMDEKQALRAQLDAAERAAPVALETLASDVDWTRLRYRPVVATGEYDVRRQILVDNKVHGGRAGYHVITPLALADGRTVLVNRGWIAQGATRAQLPVVPPPTGPVSVRGRLALPAAGQFELAADTVNGSVWQNLDPARFAELAGAPALPVVVEATSAPVPDDGLVRAWPAPDFGVEKHRIYMLQWYALAALAVGLWLFFLLRRYRSPR